MTDFNTAQYAFKNAVNLYNDNNLNESIEQLNEILKIHPNHDKSLDLLGIIYIKQNKADKALKVINKSIEINKDIKKYLDMKYKLLIYKGDNNNALDCLKLLHKKYPSVSTAREISNHYLDLDDHEKADQTIQDFIESDKTYSELYKGIRHVKANRDREAEKAYKNVLKKDKNNVDALRLLGLLATKNRKYSVAEKLFTRAINLQPYYKLLWDNLAKCYRFQNKLTEAKKAFTNLLKLDPNNFEAIGASATMSIRLGQYKEGIKLYKELLQFQNNNPRVHLSMGHAYKTIGERSNSENAYHKAIEQFPLCGEGYWSLANLKTYEFSDDQIKSMEDALKEEMNEVEKIQMLFALGKAYESLKDYKKSIHYYKDGNWLHRKTINYNAQNNSDSIDKVINFFEKNKGNINFESGFKSNEPIFVLGLPRAGSTLLEQILSAHSEIEGTQELGNIMHIGRQIRTSNNSEDYLNNLLTLNDKSIRSYGKNYIDETKWARNEDCFFIDKMPNNFPHIGLIKMILPNAKIIDARRNPMDACFSCFKQYFAKGQHFTYDLDDIARYYKDYLKIMEFWNSYFPGSIHTVMYEDVIENPEKEVRSMIDFLNLDFQESCLSFYKSSRPVKTASSEQVRQPIYKSALNYWKNFEDDLNELTKHFPEHG